MSYNKQNELPNFNYEIGNFYNPTWLPEITIYGLRPLPWSIRAFNNVGKFFNDEIFLNKNNIRVKNARAHPKAMNAVQEGGNIVGAIAVAPLAAYTAVQAAPVIMPALKVAGLAMTPSTWIGGLSQAAGYLAPAWMLNGADLALSAYFANEAGKDIDQNGLTWRTGLNALMSLAPFTRETEAINGVANTVKKPMSAVNSVVDDFRAARNAVSKPETALARGLLLSKNTSSPIYEKLILTANLYGTKDLNGFYIQLRFDGPFLNEDLEWIAHNFNSGALKKDNIGTYRRFKLGDLEKFKLRYNGGETFTLELRLYNPSSKTEEWYEVMNGPIGEIREYMELVRNNTMKNASPIQKELINHYEAVKEYESGTRLNEYTSFPEVTNEVKKILLNDIDNFYMSPEYMDKLETQIRENPDIKMIPNLKNEFYSELTDLKDNTIPVAYGTTNLNSGMSQTLVYSIEDPNTGELLGFEEEPYIGINVNHHKFDFPEFTITHENGHNMWRESKDYNSDRFPVFSAITELNKRNFGDPRLYARLEAVIVNDDAQIKYMTNVNEFSLRIREGIKDGILKGYSPELIYNESPVFERTFLKKWYPKDYLIKALSTGLGLTPILNNNSMEKINETPVWDAPNNNEQTKEEDKY